jgi:hypothetical protein
LNSKRSRIGTFMEWPPLAQTTRRNRAGMVGLDRTQVSSEKICPLSNGRRMLQYYRHINLRLSQRAMS